MKLFLTGGTGFFGKALLRYWISNHSAGLIVPEVCVLSRSPKSFLLEYPEFANLSWLTFVSGDMLEPQSLPQNELYSHILHAAADARLGPKLKPHVVFDQVVVGTQNMLQFAIRAEAKRFLFVSSGAVYGRQPADIDGMPEHWHGMPDPMETSNTYGVAKRTAEHLCALFQDTYGIEAVVARCFAFVGQDLPLDAHFAIGNFVRDALYREFISVEGDGTPLRSYLDQRELAHWLFRLLQMGVAGHAYNVGSDKSISIADLAHLIRNTLAPKKEVIFLKKSFGNIGRSRYIPDIKKVSNSLNLKVCISLKDSLIYAASKLKTN